jgi:deazaflavin-dependent oxidoreductase (nitroreductase family)
MRRVRRPIALVAVVVVGAVAAIVVAYLRYARSPAYSDGNPLFYREGRATGPGRVFGRVWSMLADRSLTPSFIVTLETVGWKTGRHSAIPVVLADLDGERYVVSMLGERPPWVRNVRAADGRVVIRHGRPRDVRLVEVPAEDRAPILQAYLGRASGARPHIPVDPGAPLEDFARIAGDYPVFRIEEIAGPG